MRRVPLAVALFLGLAMMPALPAQSQSYVDLAVTDISMVCEGDSVTILPVVTLGATCFDSVAGCYFEIPVTDVSYYIDGAFFDARDFWVDPFVLGVWDCPFSRLPDCDGDCPVIHGLFMDWYGYCEPRYSEYWPWPEPYRCGCDWSTIPPSLAVVIENTGWDSLTVRVDASYHVVEWDEDNNEMTVSFGPSSTEGASWGTIKSLYR